MNCPYCNGLIFDNIVDGHICPYCNQQVWRRQAPGDTVHRLVTTAQATQIDLAWKKTDENRKRTAPGVSFVLEVRAPDAKDGDELLKEIREQ